MHVIYLVRGGRHGAPIGGRKHHTDQSHRILLTQYFFLPQGGAAFWSLAFSSTMGTTRLLPNIIKCSIGLHSFLLSDVIWNSSTSRSTSTPNAFEVITVNALYKLLTYLLFMYGKCARRDWRSTWASNRRWRNRMLADMQEDGSPTRRHGSLEHPSTSSTDPPLAPTVTLSTSPHHLR